MSDSLVIAIDLDGTLLDADGRVPARNRAALHAAHEAGHRVVLCTGRTFTETEPVIEEIGLDLDAAVSMGGALLTDVRSRRTLEAVGFSSAVRDDVLDWFSRRGLAVLWAHDRTQIGHDGYVAPGPRRHPAIDRWLDLTRCRIETDFDSRPDELCPLRISVIDDPEPLMSLAAEYASEFGSRVSHNVIDVPHYGFTVLESFSGGVDKWTALERLCRRWNRDPRRTVAIGDDVNDLPMIRNAGLGVAIGNARPAVRAAAARVVAPHAEGGVGELLEGLLSGEIRLESRS